MVKKFVDYFKKQKMKTQLRERQVEKKNAKIEDVKNK